MRGKGGTHTLSRKTPVSSRPSLVALITDMAPFRWPSTIFVEPSPSFTNYTPSQLASSKAQSATSHGPGQRSSSNISGILTTS